MKKTDIKLKLKCSKLIITYVVYLFFINHSLTQIHPSTDSLFIEISNTKNDSTLLELYQMVIRSNWYYDIELCRACTDTSLQIAINSNSKYFIANSSHNYGLYHRFKGNADSAIYHFEKALELYGPIKDSTKMSGTLFNLAVMNSIKGNSEKALPYFIDYKKIHEKSGNRLAVCEADNSIGLVFLDMKEFTKSEEYLKNSLQCAIETDHSLTKSIALGNLQSLYVTWDKYEESIEYGRQALQIERQLNNIGGIGLISNNLSLAFNNLNQKDSAIYYAELGINSLERKGEMIHLSESYTNMGHLLNSNNDYKEAISYFKKSEDLNKKGGFKHVSLKTYNGMSYAYEQMKAYEASLYYKKKYINISDSLLNAEKFEIIANLELEYESVQKDNELKDHQLTIIKQSSLKNIFMSSAIFLALIALSIFWNLKTRLRATKKFALQESTLQMQKIDQLEKENKILSMSSMIEGQESERKRIAQDLHDSLGGLLATIKVKFGIIQKEVAAIESMNVYQQTSTMIDDACTEVRKIAHNMMPDSLTKLGLVEAVRDIAGYTSDIDVELIDLGTHTFTETEQIMLYRIIQEFLNNTRKHAKASQVIMQFSKDDNQSIIYLEDDGLGFDTNHESDQIGIGLKSMKSRINFINGTYKLNSVIGVGTTLEIYLPK